MKIAVWGINYTPEVAGIGPHNTALCEFLQARGHDVAMLTTFCYYPAWRKLPGERGRLYRQEEVNGVAVHRCWHYVPRRPSLLKRILHEFSFAVTSTARLLTLERPDLIVVVSPPLFLGAAAWLAGSIHDSPFIFHVQDLQPDAALGLGMLDRSLFARALYKLEAAAYAKALRVSGISRGMLEAFSKKQVPASKQIYFPNTITIPRPGEIPARGIFRTKHGLGRDDFLAVHSGNLGMKHGLQNLVEAAALLHESRVKIVISGEGAARDALAASIARLGLKNVLLLPLQSDSDYRALLADADLCLITQQKGSGRSFLPSKLLNALAWSKPVLAVADDDSELTKVLTEGQFGWRVQPDEPAILARELDRLSASANELAIRATAGRRFVEQFDREKVLQEFAEAIEGIGK